MVPQTQRSLSDIKRNNNKRFPWLLRVVVSISIIIILAFIVATFLILRDQGITQSISILTVISIVVGFVIGMLSLVVSFLQWHHPKAPVSSEQHLEPLFQVTPQSVVQHTKSLFPSIDLQQSKGEQDKEVMLFHKNTHPSIDWGEAPHVEQFYGRGEELTELKRWIVDDHCRIVAILGMGGIGKTSLAVQLVDQIKGTFSYVFFRSLQNAPPLKNFLRICIQYISDKPQTTLLEDTDAQILLLLTYLQEYRCLIILDNVESILQVGSSVGGYREEYEGYGKLIQRLGEARHQSCLIITSREKLQEIAFLEGNKLAIRGYRLGGLKVIDGQTILEDKGLSGTEHIQKALISHYVGNPLALKLVSQFIQEVFDGDIARFLENGELIFSDIQDVLDQQFERLSIFEQEIMYWLAVERKAVSLDDLLENNVQTISRRVLSETIRSLRRRSLVETYKGEFTLQNVIMEYITQKFIKSVLEEFRNETVMLLGSHSLIKAHAKDYIRESQISIILKPLSQQLLTVLSISEAERKCKNIFKLLRKMPSQQTTYAAGNIINLLVQLNIDISNYDFSHLTIRQAYLQGVVLSNVNFSYSDLGSTIFTDSFGSVLSVAMSSDGRLLAAGTADGEVRLWNVADGTLLYTRHEHKDWVRSVAFSPDGQLLASGCYDQTVRLWNVSTGSCLRILRDFQGWVSVVAFSPNGQFLAVGSEDYKVRLWRLDYEDEDPWQVFSGHNGKVYALAFSPNGQLLASAGEDASIYLWDVEATQLHSVWYGHEDWIQTVTFSPDGKLLASGSGDGKICLWESSSGRCVHTLSGHEDCVQALAFSPDGRWFASGSDDRTVHLWQTGSWDHENVLLRHNSSIYGVVFSPLGMLISGGLDQTIRFWEPPDWVRVKTLQGYSSSIYSIAFNAAGRQIASGSDDGKVWLWDVETGHSLTYFEEKGCWIYALAFSQDGKLLASGSDDQRIRIWDCDEQRLHSSHKKIEIPLKTLEGHRNWILSVAFSQDGKLLASGGRGLDIRLWEVGTWICIHVLKGHAGRVRSLAFSPDGKLLVSCSEDKTLRFWDVVTGLCLRILQGHSDSVYTIAFSPDGTLIASGSKDGSIRLWEGASGECVCTLNGHSNWVWSVAFSPDGTLLVSGSEDKTVRLWDVKSGRCLNTFHGHTSWVQAVAFHPVISQHTIASGSHDGTIRFWDTRATTNACLRILSVARPYDGMRITHAINLAEAQRMVLKELGAVEN